MSSSTRRGAFGVQWAVWLAGGRKPDCIAGYCRYRSRSNSSGSSPGSPWRLQQQQKLPLRWLRPSTAAFQVGAVLVVAGVGLVAGARRSACALARSVTVEMPSSPLSPEPVRPRPFVHDLKLPAPSGSQPPAFIFRIPSPTTGSSQGARLVLPAVLNFVLLPPPRRKQRNNAGRRQLPGARGARQYVPAALSAPESQLLTLAPQAAALVSCTRP